MMNILLAITTRMMINNNSNGVLGFGLGFCVMFLLSDGWLLQFRFFPLPKSLGLWDWGLFIGLIVEISVFNWFYGQCCRGWGGPFSGTGISDNPKP